MRLVSDYPARLVCRLLDFPRCRLYRASRDDAAVDAPLREALQRLAAHGPAMANAAWRPYCGARADRSAASACAGS
jgi:hypothetical protein